MCYQIAEDYEGFGLGNGDSLLMSLETSGSVNQLSPKHAPTQFPIFFYPQL